MATPSPLLHRRRLRGLAAAGCAALVLPLLSAAPAAAQTTTTTTTRTAETLASSLRISVNLPQGNEIVLDVSTASGRVTSVTGKGPEAEALATLLRGSVAGEARSFPGAEARLPEPRESQGQSSDLSEGIADSPFGEFLAVGLVESSAKVTEAPSSESTAQVAELALGLPAQLNDALQQVLTPLLEGLDEIIAGLAPTDAATAALCDGISPITDPVGEGVEDVPVLGPVAGDVLDGVTDPEAGVLCNLRIFLGEVQDALALSLADLAGPGGLFSAGLLSATQSITTEGQKTTARAEARIADVEVAGAVNPFGDVTALNTTSTAVIDGPTSSTAVETNGIEAFAAPLLELETDLDTITGDLAGIELDGLTALLDEIQVVLDGLAGIGVSAGPLDDVVPQLEACPEALSPLLSGTFEEEGVCAAAASAGFGLAVELPEELAGPLGIEGPLVALQLVPTAAVVRNAVTTTTAPAAPPVQPRALPRTGAEAPVAAVGLALLVGAALVRRRRAAADV